MQVVRSQPKTDRITFRLAPEENQALRSEAQKRNLSPSAYLRELAIAAIKKTPAA